MWGEMWGSVWGYEEVWGKLWKRWGKVCGMRKSEERCGKVSWVWREVKEMWGVFENVGRGVGN